MTKKYTFIIAILIINIAALGQSTSTYSTDTLIYNQCLSWHIQYLNDLQTKGIIKVPEQNIYNIEYFTYLKEIPFYTDKYKINFVDKAEIKRKGKKNQFHLIIIEPIKVNKNLLSVRIIDFNVSYKKKNYSYINMGGSVFLFEYDCNKKGFILKKKQQGAL